ncbi:MAG: threonylcarbamoyl-AMP synthase [Hyphococcus sp.]|nr:MAG: threonylcarbamoyl-AMP synthase [Marinicaulis sp.]
MFRHDDKDLRITASTILSGGLVAMPTETVYGLATDATNDEAVARIFEAKGRPQFNPLICHVTGADMAMRYVEFSPLALKLAENFWPGPLTLVLPRKSDSEISLLASAGLGTLGVRAPNHPIAQRLIQSVGRPLAAPSANRSGSISPTTAAHVEASLGERIDMIIDGGACSVGLESTIVKVDGDKVYLLRPGGISREAIENIAGQKKIDVIKSGEKIEAPGMMTSHYAPKTGLRLNATAPKDGEAYLGFGEHDAQGQSHLNLSKTGDLREAAAHLFDYLHALDRIVAAHRLKNIAVAPIPVTGLGEAINDRLNRAAAPKC